MKRRNIKNHPPVETIKKIALGLGIPPEYFLEYRINKLIKILMNNPAVNDVAFDFARELVNNDNLKVVEKEFIKYYPSTSKAN